MGNPIVDIRQSYVRLISTMGFPKLVRCRLYMGEVTKLWLSCSLVLLSLIAKPGNKTASVSWPDSNGTRTLPPASHTQPHCHPVIIYHWSHLPLMAESAGTRALIQYKDTILKYQYRKSHCGDKTVIRLSYFHKGIPILIRLYLYIESRPCFNRKTTSYQYRKSHCADKTVRRLSYIHNGISYTGEMSSLYWISPLVRTWWSHSKANFANLIFVSDSIHLVDVL